MKKTNKGATRRGSSAEASPGTTDRMCELEQRGLVSIGWGRVSERLWQLPLGEDPTASVRKALIADRQAGAS